MSGLKEIRNRISSIASTMQITGAMKMVSASKLKRAHDAIVSLRPYSEQIQVLLKRLSLETDNYESVFTKKRPVNTVLIVAITSNRGLCGAFNSNVVKEVNNLCKTTYKDKDVTVAAIGKRGIDVLKKTHELAFSNFEIYDDMSYINTSKIAKALMTDFKTGIYDEIVLVYNHSKNAATQIIKSEQLLPLPRLREADDTQQPINNNEDYICEPSKGIILDSLIPKTINIILYRVLRDSIEAEHGARMTAMHKATDNASELKSELTLIYNKERQASITAEILEIVGGAESLGNS